MQDRKISFQELRDGLTKDKEYNQGCKKLLEDYLFRNTLTEHNFTGPVFGLGCLDKLLRIWLGYEGLPFYLTGQEQPVRFDFDEIKPITFLQEESLSEIEITKPDLERFLFSLNLPLPTPDVENKNPWFHGRYGSTEVTAIGDEPYHDENFVRLVYDKTILEERAYIDDREAEKQQRIDLEIKKQQFELHTLYCKKRDYPVTGSDEYKLLWSELSRFYEIKKEFDELEGAFPGEWRLQRKRLLKQEIEAIEGWCKHKRKSPTTCEQEVLRDYPSLFAEKDTDTGSGTKKTETLTGTTSEEENYFILSGDNWRVRFNGGREVDIRDLKPIQTLVEYLAHPDEPLDRASIYLQLHGDRRSNDIVITAECDETQGKASGKTLLVNERLTPEAKRSTEKYARELADEIDFLLIKGKDLDACEPERKLAELRESVRKEYRGHMDDKGKITWGKIMDKTEYDKYSKLTQKHLRRAIKTIKEKERQNKSLVGLAEHLEKYLLNNKDCYRPPDNFPEFAIIH